MNYSLKNIKWLRVIIAAFAAVVISFLVIIITTTVYAFVLAIKAHGSPDHFAIGYFAGTISKWVMPLLVALLTFFLAKFTAKKVETNLPMHGLLIGIFAAILNVAVKLYFTGGFGYKSFILFLIISFVGFLGGYAGQKQIEKKSTPAA